MTTVSLESSQVACGRCKTPLPPDLFNRAEALPCPNCGTATKVATFPAFGRKAAGAATLETIVAEGEAGCFFHPAKKAVVACGNCGRFLCGLCDLELGGRHLCPNCLESGKQKGKLAEIDHQRTCYGNIALGLALGSVLFVPVSVITAPIVLYLVIRHWKTPGSLVGGAGRKRRIAAAALAVGELITLSVLIALGVMS
jgi:hypothetical protein